MSHRTSSRLSAWLPLTAALAAFAICLCGLTVPSFWRDEAVTAELTGRSLPELLRALDRIDAVHGFYYLLMWPLTTLLGPSELVLRLPSALGAAAAAGLTTVLGRRLGSDRFALTAGLLVAISPFISRHAQEARQYTLVTALAVLSTWLLVRAADRRGWAWYGLSLLLLGFLHLFALLILPAHLIARRDAWRAWAISAGAALVPTAGLVLVAARERYQVAWIEPLTGRSVLGLAQALGWGPILLVPCVLLIGLAVWRRSPVVGVALPWLLLPPALLLGISLIKPYYVQRYLLFCVPAAALLIAAGLELLPWRPAVPLLMVAAAATVPAQLDLRHQASRLDDLRALSQIVAEHKRPGDAIVFTDVRYRPVLAAYPSAFHGLRDVLLATSPAGADDLRGRELPRGRFVGALAGSDRVWLVHNWLAFLPGSDAQARAKRRLLGPGSFEPLGHWRYKGGEVLLYRRVQGSGAPADQQVKHGLSLVEAKTP